MKQLPILPSHGPPSDVITWLPIAVLAVSIAAVVVGPAIQYKIAKRQMVVSLQTAKLAFRASVISASRQAWIDTVRASLADFFAKQDYIWMTWSSALKKEISVSHESMAKELSDLTRIENRVILMLDDTNQEQAELKAQIARVHGLLNSEEIRKGPSEMEEATNAVRTAARAVLKKESERARRGK